MLRIGDTWTTSKYKETLYAARQTGPILLHKKYEWTDELFDMVHWYSIKRVQANLTHIKKMQTCKIMYGRLPLGYTRHHITGINQCPGCECKDETIQHLFQCQNQQMKDKRNQILKQFNKKGHKGKLPPHILQAISRIIAIKGADRSVNWEGDEMTEISKYTKPTYDTAVKEAIPIRDDRHRNDAARLHRKGMDVSDQSIWS